MASEPIAKKPKSESHGDSDGNRDGDDGYNSTSSSSFIENSSDESYGIGPVGQLSDYDKYSDVSSEWSDEELRKEYEEYYDQIEASDGFDVTSVPSKPPIGGINPIDRDPEKDFHIPVVAECANVAIDKYNQKYNARLQLEKIVNTVIGTASGWLYYITFEGKDLNSPEPEVKTYQTRVWYNIVRDRKKVRLFRLKPEKKPKTKPGTSDN